MKLRKPYQDTYNDALRDVTKACEVSDHKVLCEWYNGDRNKADIRC